MMKSILVGLALLVCAAIAQTTPTPELKCNPVTFYVEEGQLLKGDLTSVPTRVDFNGVLYTTTESNGITKVGGLNCVPTFTLKASTGPSHHTGTPSDYTPIVSGAFSVGTDGKFDYINLPKLDNFVVWNGFDRFTFEATCTVDTQTYTCSDKAYVNVLFTSASSHNSAQPSFVVTGNGMRSGIQCSGSCDGNGAVGTNEEMWMVRHQLPRRWDVQADEKGTLIMPKVLFGGVQHDTDGLDFEWSTNYALISTYGAIANMAVRFPTMEEITWKPGQMFESTDFTNKVNGLSTGFDLGCLDKQSPYPTSDAATNLWTWSNPDLLQGEVPSGHLTVDSWYLKFGGKHKACDAYMQGPNTCKVAPLLTPRTSQVEDDGGVWRLIIEGCALKWQGKFTWNALRNQPLSNSQAWSIVFDQTSATHTIKGNIYNEAVQPNSWTEPKRGFAWISHLYKLTVVLGSDINYEFSLGVDVFTVDVQQFRYLDLALDHSIGFNMIVYPKITTGVQSQPDRRVLGLNWVSQDWVAPAVSAATNDEDFSTTGRYINKIDNGFLAPGVAANFPVKLFRGPKTTATDCTNVDKIIVLDTFSISPQDPDDTNKCQVGYQNVTLRATAPGSKDQNNIGFEGKIVLTFLLANGEHPHFVLSPKMYITSISVNGAFAGSSSTCRGSPYWPVDSDTKLPDYLCEEVDARTFGPTDWASIMFDIKDVDPDLVSLKTLYIVFNEEVTIQLFPLATGETIPKYLNFRNLKDLWDDTLAFTMSADGTYRTLTYPTGSALPPKNPDFAFAFTPGAYNENTKVQIYCTLTVNTETRKSRRFKGAAGESNDNTLQQRIEIQRDFNAGRVSATSVQAGSSSSVSSRGSASGSSNVTVAVLAAACAVLLAAVVGMVLYIVRNNGSVNVPKRVNSTG